MKEPHTLNRSPSIVRVIKSRRFRCRPIDESRTTFNILTGKTHSKETSRNARSRWEDNVSMNLRDIGINARYWVDSALANAILNLRVPYAMDLLC